MAAAPVTNPLAEGRVEKLSRNSIWTLGCEWQLWGFQGALRLYSAPAGKDFLAVRVVIGV